MEIAGILPQIFSEETRLILGKKEFLVLIDSN
jgi:hypothetical protein